MRPIERTRRAYPEGIGGLASAGVAGCLGGDGGAADGERPPGVSEAAFERGRVHRRPARDPP